MAKIELQKVVKSFEGFRALDGLDLNVPAGAVYGLVGPNGAGKTTAIRHICGILKADEGRVSMDGEDVFENVALKNRLAFIPDDPFYFPQATIRDMMKYYRGIYPRFDMDRYEKLREAFSLDEKHAFRRLSRGMQKQAAFWLALSTRPDVLVLDEPVDGLDPVMRRQIWSLIMGDVAENGTTVLISSHNLRELEDVCDHVGILHRGKCLLERPLSELQENILKVLVALPDGVFLPEGLDIVHRSATGKLLTLICRGSAEEVTARLQSVSPLFMDTLPLSLEEIFIYELGGTDYAVREILL